MDVRKLRPSRTRQPVVVLAASCVALLAIAACASSTAAPDSSSSSGTGTHGYAEAAAVVAQYTKRPTSVGVTAAIGKPIPKGKTIDFMSLGVPQTQAQLQGMTQAAKLLGWKVNVIQAGLTAQSTIAAFNQAVTAKPSAVYYTATPRQEINPEIAKLHAEGTLVVGCCSTDQATNGISWLSPGPNQYGGPLQGKLLAAWTVYARQGKPNAVLWYLPEQPITTQIKDSFEHYYKQYCPSCQLAVQQTALADLGQTFPDTVVGYLRSHPNVNFVTFASDQMDTGVASALALAGLSKKVEFAGDGPATSNFEAVADGQQSATVGPSQIEIGWRAVDALARLFAGSSIAPANGPPSYWILNQKTIKEYGSTSEYLPYNSNMVQQFKTLWGLGS
jgi:ribose transport system substrate-binding protein